MFRFDNKLLIVLKDTKRINWDNVQKTSNDIGKEMGCESKQFFNIIHTVLILLLIINLTQY